MPLINVHLADGHSAAKKREFMAALTAAACETLGVSEKSVRVWITPIAEEDYMAGGVWLADQRAIARRSTTTGVSQ